MKLLLMVEVFPSSFLDILAYWTYGIGVVHNHPVAKMSLDILSNKLY